VNQRVRYLCQGLPISKVIVQTERHTHIVDQLLYLDHQHRTICYRALKKYLRYSLFATASIANKRWQIRFIL